MCSADSVLILFKYQYERSSILSRQVCVYPQKVYTTDRDIFMAVQGTEVTCDIIVERLLRQELFRIHVYYKRPISNVCLYVIHVYKMQWIHYAEDNGIHVCLEAS